MRLTKKELRTLMSEEYINIIQENDERVSEMREFAGSRSGSKVVAAGNKIASAGRAISEIAADQTGAMKAGLNRISEFVEKLGASLGSINSISEGESVTETLPTVSEFRKMIKELRRLEK